MMTATLATTLTPSASTLLAVSSLGSGTDRWLVELARSMVTCALAELGRLPVQDPLAGSDRYPAMLTVLTYSYATGVFGSTDVELLLLGCAPLRELFRSKPPDANELRRFRRANRPVLLRCLTTTLRRLRDVGLSVPVERNAIGPGAGCAEEVGVGEMELRRQSQVESLTRIQRAVREDSSLCDE